MNFFEEFNKHYNKHFVKLKTYGNRKKFNIEIAKKNMLDVKESFDKYNLKSWLIFGTLLGVYRDNDLIKHDFDVDFGIFDDDNINKLFDITDDLLKKGITPLRIDKSNNKEDIISYGRNFEYVDIYFFKKIYNKFYFRDLAIIDSHYFETFNKIKFIDKEFLIPSDTENLLEDIYGSDWRIPIKGKSAFWKKGK